ncbi:hypothetical protein [Nocardioides alcanivorans]|uniref:hypothetical protein n=1 Tax=Nocardioides alcanivorans TaxID=2897352 RepID=UPI001F264442|nr:hypothetical protein [Nocardioides alcanivorans]
MRVKRLFGGLLSAALLGLVPVSLATVSAEAATVMPTTLSGQISVAKAKYGSSFYISGKINSAAGYPKGTVTLKRKLASESAFKTIGTYESYGSWGFYNLKAVGNASYQVSYSGGSDSGSNPTYTYSASAVTTNQKVMRDLGDTISRTTLKGKVKPDYKKKKVTIQVKATKKGKWKKFATVKTNKKGKWAKKLPAKSKCTYWRAFAKGDKKFVKSFSNYSYYTVRGYKSC